MMLYLDNAATSFKKPFGVYYSLLKNTLINSANSGRGGHFYSIRTAKEIYETSLSLSELLNIKNPEQIAYTPNATYALNLAISGLLDEDTHVVITQMEHNSVLRPVHKLSNYTMVKADKNGYVEPCDIEKAIKPNTKLVIVSHISNVCGTIQDIDKISKIAHKKGVLFMVDASQSIGCAPIDVEKTNIDILAFSGHKGLMTPQGVGGIYVREGITLKPVITGGTGSLSQSLTQPDFMPDLLQSGTMNAPAIISAKKSIDLIIKKTPVKILEKDSRLASKLYENLKNIKNIKLYGNYNKNRNGTVAFNIDGIDSVRCCEILNNDFKICTRGGWHCAYPSHIALGTQDFGAVRASFGFFNSKKDVDTLSVAVSKIALGAHN